jgi:exodeoxyribonuclease VIII
MVTANYTRDILTDTYAIGELLSGKFRGVIHGMPSARYHSSTSYYSSSDLKHITKYSPYHFKVMRDKGIGRVKQTDDMILGSLVHCLLLTPNDFDQEFMLLPTLDRRTKVGREAYQLACDTAGDRIVTDVETYDMAREMVDSVKKNSYAMEILDLCKTEVSYFWKCPFSGLRLRARVDACTSSYLVELKTSRSAAPSAFERQAYNMHYDLSACHYSEGLSATGGERPRTVYFIVVENEPPFVSQVYKADESFMESGHTKWLDAVQKLESAIANNKWPGYSVDGVLPLSAPRWSVKNVVDEVTDGI